MALIREKYRIKNTTGYSINALADFSPQHPVEILKRLMVGSEGTLGFVSRVTYNTVPDLPHKASAFLIFRDIEEACDATSALKANTAVDAVEIFDRRSLTQCERMGDLPKLCPEITRLPEDGEGAALLIECRGEDEAALKASINQVLGALRDSKVPVASEVGYTEKAFRHDPKEYNVFWDARKGLIPIVGGARETGTSMLLEDVACSTEKLGQMSKDLIGIFRKWGYHDACLMGHALEGNLHLIFNQSFKTPEEVKRYENVMYDINENVAIKHGGSLKAEHGTGRNVAPFVEMEWGTKAYEVMWEVKKLFDPAFLLNPGVILNEDPDVHAKNLRVDHPSHPLVDRCISCGWCESNCPSRDLSLTPRQRIQVFKEMTKMREDFTASGERHKPERLVAFEESWKYAEATCAADGMCQEKCPVKINTGELIKTLRQEALEGHEEGAPPPRGAVAAAWVAGRFGPVMGLVPPMLNVVSLAHSIIGTWPMQTIANAVWGVGNNMIPLWNPYMPQGAAPLKLRAPPAAAADEDRKKVVYLPACVTRSMGPARGDADAKGEPVHAKFLSILDKADYDVIIPEGVGSSCCGMIFDSRGYRDVGKSQAEQLEAMLIEASHGGKYPIVCDTSPCLHRMKEKFTDPMLKMAMHEPVQFISLYLKDRLDFAHVRDTVAVHVPCSSKKLKLNDEMVSTGAATRPVQPPVLQPSSNPSLPHASSSDASTLETPQISLAERCAKEVHATPIPCCGMAGDRGMRYPELTGSSLQHLNLPSTCSDGYSTSRTCEMSLSNHAGINFRSLLYLVDEATTPKHKIKAGTAAKTEQTGGGGHCC